MLRNLVCTAVVNGLDNFAVAGTAKQSVAGYIDPMRDYIATCANPVTVEVSSGLVINVFCDVPMSTQFLIIQSLDFVAEQLCIAEVEVYGEYATMFISVLHVTRCLSETVVHFLVISRRIIMLRLDMTVCY